MMADIEFHLAAWFHTAKSDKNVCAVCAAPATYVLRTTASRMGIRETTYTQAEWDKHSEDWVDNHDHREYRCAAHAPRIRKRLDADNG